MAQEADKYEPDLIFVSFGWSDLAHAIGLPDKHYKPKSDALVLVLRELIKYRSYQAIQHYVRAPRLKEQASKEVQHRVPLEDYIENLQSFSNLAHKKGVTVVFLSRPYKYTTKQILKNETWRSKASSYNRMLAEHAHCHKTITLSMCGASTNWKPGGYSVTSHTSTRKRTGLKWVASCCRQLESHGLL